MCEEVAQRTCNLYLLIAIDFAIFWSQPFIQCTRHILSIIASIFQHSTMCSICPFPLENYCLSNFFKSTRIWRDVWRSPYSPILSSNRTASNRKPHVVLTHCNCNIIRWRRHLFIYIHDHLHYAKELSRWAMRFLCIIRTDKSKCDIVMNIRRCRENGVNALIKSSRTSTKLPA